MQQHLSVLNQWIGSINMLSEPPSPSLESMLHKGSRPYPFVPSILRKLLTVRYKLEPTFLTALSSHGQQPMNVKVMYPSVEQPHFCGGGSWFERSLGAIVFHKGPIIFLETHSFCGAGTELY